jgi:hypothetical protein
MEWGGEGGKEGGRREGEVEKWNVKVHRKGIIKLHEKWSIKIARNIEGFKPKFKTKTRVPSTRQCETRRCAVG